MALSMQDAERRGKILLWSTIYAAYSRGNIRARRELNRGLFGRQNGR